MEIGLIREENIFIQEQSEKKKKKIQLMTILENNWKVSLMKNLKETLKK